MEVMTTGCSRESKKEMVREYWADWGGNGSYGLGFSIYKIKKRKIVGNDGIISGFVTQISLDVENDIGVITLTNTSGSTIPDQKKFEGIYRLRRGDRIVVGIDTSFIAFSPQANSSVKDGRLLKAKGKNGFLIEQDGEFATCTFISKRGAKRATKVLFGATPSERLE